MVKVRRVKLPEHRKSLRKINTGKVRRLSVPVAEVTKELEISDTVRALQQEIQSLPDKLLMEQYHYAMTEVAKDGDLSRMLELARYRRGVVPLDEFLHSDTYLGIDPKEIYPAVRDVLEAVETEQYVEAVLKGSIGIGKALSLDTPMLTTEGWKTMGTLVRGDKVFDENGEPCNVTEVHVVRKNRKCYRVVFSDGAEIIADAEHLWYTETRADRIKKRTGTVKTTEEILRTLKAEGRFNNHSVPLHDGVRGEPAKFDIDPYVFGCWLGDGSSAEARFYCHDNDYEVVQLMEASGASMRRLEYVSDDKCPTYLIEATGCIGFRNALARHGLLGNKHIPEALLLGSYEQRLALLQGLMDTDGTCSKQTGVCEITLVSKRLSDDVLQLLWLLGLKPTQSIKIVKGRDYHRITFTAYRDAMPVFRLARKLAIQPAAGAQAIRQRSRYIVDIQSIASVPVRCITVDSPSHLYLAGRELVPTHNTTAANLGMIRQIYKLACMRSPQQTFGLQRHSSIVFTIQSVRLATAKRAVFDEMGKFIHNSPFFNEIYPYDKRIASSMYFREHHVQILPVSSSDTGAISMNVIGGMLDEVNFMERIKQSKNANADETGEYDQAKTLYLTLSKRRRSRFMNRGKLPGTLFLVSSSRYPDDFTETKAAEAQMCGGDDPEIYVMSKSLWDGRGRDKYSDEEFRVLLGNERQRARILGDDEIIDDPEAEIINVPVDLRPEFDKDIGGAIRDFAGRTTLASRPFIYNREALFDCMSLAEQFAYESVIPVQEIDLETTTPYVLPDRVRDDVKQMRVAHVDLAISRDSAGLAVGHVAGTKTIERIHPETNERIIEVLPVIAYDCILRVMPPRDGEIDFAKIRQIIYDLRDLHGLPISVVTTDGFQSVDFRQILAKKGFATEYVSLDRTTQPYKTFRDALYDRRVLLPRHNTLIKELTELEYVQHKSKEKIDHKPRGSKDVADAVCGVAMFLLTRRNTWTTQPTFKGPGGLMLHGHRTGLGSVELEELSDDEINAVSGRHGRPSVQRRSLDRMKSRRRPSLDAKNK